MGDTMPSSPPETIDEKSVPVAMLNEDDARIVALGYKPELARHFGLFSSVGICMAIIGCTPSITVSFANGLSSGGPVAIIYGWILSVLMGLCIASSMGEIASGFPLAGALYNYSAALAPPKYRIVVCFFTGWMNLLGQLAITIAVVYAAAELVIAMAVIGSGTDDMGNFIYQPERVHTVCVYWACLIVSFFINMAGSRPLSYLNRLDVLFLTFGTIIIIVTLLALNDNKNDASFVFGGFNNETGWSNNGFAWLIGLLQSCYTLTGYDGAAHMSEETVGAARNAPLGMVIGVGASGVVGLTYLIPLLFCTGNIDDVLATTTGLPAAQIFYNSTNQAGALGLLFLVFCMQFLCGVASMTASSRMAWAFSRDDALPFAKYIKRVYPRNHVPIWAMFFLLVIEFAVGCVAIGSTTAFFAFTSVTTIALYISYVIPTLLLNLGGRKRFTPGPFTLGRWSPYIGWIAIAWVAFTGVLFILPEEYPVNATNMNYAIALMGGYFIFCTIYWFYKRKTFKGPKSHLAEVVGVTVSVEEYKKELEDRTDV